MIEIQLRRMVACSARTRATATRLQSWAYHETREAARLLATSEALAYRLNVAPPPKSVPSSMPPTERRRRHLDSAVADLGRTQRMLAWTQRSLEMAREENAMLRQQLATVHAQLADTEQGLAATVLELCEMNRELQDAYNEQATAHEAVHCEDSDSSGKGARLGAGAAGAA